MSQPSPPPPAPDPVTSSTNDQRSRRKKKKTFGSATTSSYIGKCEQIKLHVYDVGKHADQFAKSTKEIAGYIARTLKHGAEFANAMDPENLGFQPIVEPTPPTDPTKVIEIEQWKFA